jgi:hypothetical protein
MIFQQTQVLIVVISITIREAKVTTPENQRFPTLPQHNQGNLICQTQIKEIDPRGKLMVGVAQL